MSRLHNARVRRLPVRQGRTPYGEPVDTVELGTTQIPRALFHEFIISVRDRFAPETYHILENNCNTFSDEAARFLTGKGIPERASPFAPDR